MLTKQEKLKLNESIRASVSESFQRNFNQKEFVKTALCEAMDPQILNEGLGKSVYHFLKRTVGLTVGGTVGGYAGMVAGIGIGAVLVAATAGIVSGVTGESLVDVIAYSPYPENIGLPILMGSFTIGGIYGAWKGMVKGWDMSDPADADKKLIGEILLVTDERDELVERIKKDLERRATNAEGISEKAITAIINRHDRQLTSLTKKQISLGKAYLRKFAGKKDGNAEYLRIAEAASKGIMTVHSTKR